MKYLIALLFSVFVYGQKELPNITIKNINNESVNVKTDFNEKDKIYVFSFWATWCAPCINELEAIHQNYQEWKDLNLEVIAVSIDDARTQKRVKPLVTGKGWTYTILIDVNQDLKRALSISNVPYMAIVKNGEIISIHNGYSEGAEEEILEELKAL